MADFYASCTTCGIKTGIPIKMQRLIQSIRYAAAINLPHAVQIYPVPASNFARILSSEAAKQKKTEFIRLIDEHGKGLGKMLKPDAESLAAKKHMSLIRVEDQQISQKTPLYQLVLPKAATTKLPKQSQSKKNEPPVKVIQMSVKIGEHDMRTKTKQVSNWVAHGAEVRVAIIGSPETKDELLEAVFANVEKHLEGTPMRILQKRIVAGTMKFSILAPKKIPDSTHKQKRDSQITPQD